MNMLIIKKDMCPKCCTLLKDLILMCYLIKFSLNLLYITQSLLNVIYLSSKISSSCTL